MILSRRRQFWYETLRLARLSEFQQDASSVSRPHYGKGEQHCKGFPGNVHAFIEQVHLSNRAIDPAPADLSGSKQRPEQHGGVVGMRRSPTRRGRLGR
jgi:hypothetical protein